MKKLVIGLLLTVLLATSVAVPVACNLKKNGQKTLEQKLTAMSSEERAEMLLTLFEQRLTTTRSYTLNATSTVTLTTTERSASSVSHLTRYVAGIGTADYACHSETETTCSIAGEETSVSSAEGYRNGSIYLSADGGDGRVRLCSPLSLADYLSFERTHIAPSIDLLAPEHYTAVSSTVERDGSYTVSLSLPSTSGLSALNALLTDEGALLDAPYCTLTHLSSKITLSRDFVPSSVAITCLFDSPAGSLVTLEISAACSDVDATPTPTEPTDLNGFYPISDLRVLYILRDAVQGRQSAASGAYIYTLEQRITLDGDVYTHQTAERGTYSRANGRTAFTATVEDGSDLREISYCDGSRRTVIRDLADGVPIADSTVAMTDEAAIAYLAERLNAAGYAPTRVASVTQADADTYTLGLRDPDLSAYADVIGSRDVTATGTLTVTLKEGKLLASVYRLEIRSTVGAPLSVVHTATCTYYDDALPK